MAKSFEKFVQAWKELVDSGATEVNEATLTFFLIKNFGTSKNNFTHYKRLSLDLGFISTNKNQVYCIDKKVIELAFDSKAI